MPSVERPISSVSGAIRADATIGKKVLTMAEHVTKEQVIEWYRPYGQTDEPIPFEILVSDLRDMDAADVAPVRHGRWIQCKYADKSAKCSECGGYYTRFTVNERYPKYCPHCGAKLDLEG